MHVLFSYRMLYQLLCRLAECIIFNFCSYCKAIVPFLSHLRNSVVIVRNKLCLCFMFPNHFLPIPVVFPHVSPSVSTISSGASTVFPQCFSDFQFL